MGMVWWKWKTCLMREGIKKGLLSLEENEIGVGADKKRTSHSRSPQEGEAERCMCSWSRQLSLKTGTKALPRKPRGINYLMWKTDDSLEFRHVTAVDKGGLGWHSGFAKVFSFFQRLGANASRGVLPFLYFGRVKRSWCVLNTQSIHSEAVIRVAAIRILCIKPSFPLGPHSERTGTSIFCVAVSCWKDKLFVPSTVSHHCNPSELQYYNPFLVRQSLWNEKIIYWIFFVAFDKYLLSLT